MISRLSFTWPTLDLSIVTTKPKFCSC